MTLQGTSRLGLIPSGMYYQELYLFFRYKVRGGGGGGGDISCHASKVGNSLYHAGYCFFDEHLLAPLVSNITLLFVQFLPLSIHEDSMMTATIAIIVLLLIPFLSYSF